MAACKMFSIVASAFIAFQICMLGMIRWLEIYAQSVNVHMEDCMLGTVVLVAACEISNILEVHFRFLFTIPKAMKAVKAKKKAKKAAAAQAPAMKVVKATK